MSATTKVSVSCQTHQGIQEIAFMVGYPEPEHHPIHFQKSFHTSKGVAVPQSLTDALTKVQKLSKDNDMDFVELVEYAVKANTETADVSSANSNGEDNATPQEDDFNNNDE